MKRITLVLAAFLLIAATPRGLDVAGIDRSINPVTTFSATRMARG